MARGTNPSHAFAFERNVYSAHLDSRAWKSLNPFACCGLLVLNVNAVTTGGLAAFRKVGFHTGLQSKYSELRFLGNHAFILTKQNFSLSFQLVMGELF